jgi:homoserine kinase type II
MQKVFLVRRAKLCDDDYEDIKVIGVYSSEERAAAAIEQLKSQPGFRDFPEGFHSGPYVLDQTYWADGFITELPD